MALDKHVKLQLAACCLAISIVAPRAVAAVQVFYSSPEVAVKALLDAVKSTQPKALRAVLGSEVDEVLSGDPVQRESERARFAEAVEAGTRIERIGDGRAELAVGERAWPFPIPLIKSADGWYFDTEAGKDEIINRRIGRNELHTIASVRAYVDAQHEYAADDRTGAGAGSFAQRLRSSDGQRDGLYWPSAPGEPVSPLGPLVAAAVAQGYTGGSASDGPAPSFHGYYYRILTAQGPHAPGGAMNYLRDGRMTGGFALLAYPAEYGRSGIMTFITSDRGIVFQRDLGTVTESAVAKITEYDPGPQWVPVADD